VKRTAIAEETLEAIDRLVADRQSSFARQETL
jgi:hypothetical protein